MLFIIIIFMIIVFFISLVLLQVHVRSTRTLGVSLILSKASLILCCYIIFFCLGITIQLSIVVEKEYFIIFTSKEDIVEHSGVVADYMFLHWIRNVEVVVAFEHFKLFILFPEANNSNDVTLNWVTHRVLSLCELLFFLDTGAVVERISMEVHSLQYF